MVTEVILPKLGQTMEVGVIAEWLVQEGQVVKKGDPIFTVESDKAVLEVSAPASGVLRKILVPKGQSVPILSLVGVIAGADEDISSVIGTTGMPVVPPSVEEVVSQSAATSTTVEGPGAEAGERVVASPRARRLARLEGVPLEHIKGSGPGGRITEKDVEDYLASLPRVTPAARGMAATLGIDLAAVVAPEPGGRVTLEAVRPKVVPEPVAVSAPPVQPVAPVSVPLAGAEGERIPMTGIRAIIAQRMAASAHTTAAFTLTTEADAAGLVAWRETLKRQARQGERVPTYNDLLIRLLVKALAEHPALNARLEGEEIVRYRQLNIGIAADTERGLLVPVLHDAGRMSLSEIAAGAADLIARARAGQATPDDLSGGTFTITNLGMFDVDAFTPIINVPECAILGVGRIKERAVVRDGQIVVRPTVVLSLTIDHRAIDGAPAARFLQRLKQLIEEPLLAL